MITSTETANEPKYRYKHSTYPYHTLENSNPWATLTWTSGRRKMDIGFFFFFLNHDALLLIFSIIQDNIYKDSQWTWNIWTTIKKERKSTWSLSHISKGSQYFGLLFLIYFSFNFNTCYFLIFIIFMVFNWFSS